MLLIGCNSHAHMVLAHNALVKQAEQNRYSLLLVGGSYHRTRLTHKDVQRLIKLDQSVYTSLLNVIEGASIGFEHQLMSSQHSLLSVFTALKLKADQTTYLNWLMSQFHKSTHCLLTPLFNIVTMSRLTSHVLESVTNDSTKVLYFTNQQSNFTSPCCFDQTFVTYWCVVLDPKCVTLN